MNFDRTSEAPEEPFHQSGHTPLSPASPKPLHFPTPANVPILDMQTNVEFNQTEPHMADPAMRNTEVRPNLWRDPNEPEDHASPYSTGGEAADVGKLEAAAQYGAYTASDSADIGAPAATEQSEAIQLSNDMSHQTNATVVEVASGSEAAKPDVPPPSFDTSTPTVVPSAQYQPPIYEAQPEQAQSTSATPFGANVDVQALLNTLQAPPSASTSVANAATPFPPTAQAQQSESGHDASANLGAPPSGLPPRPPPQEQPLINPNYAQSQHIRDFHPHAANPAAQLQQYNGAPSNVADPSGQSYIPSASLPANPMTASTPQAQTQAYAFSPSAATYQHPAGAVGQPQTPSTAAQNNNYTTQRRPSTTNSVASGTPIESRREYKLAAGEVPTAEDRPWDAETQAKYDHFIETERHYVSEGRWEQFPMGSRLFVGTRNLDGSKTRKDEVTLVDEDDAAWKKYNADGSSSVLGNLSSEKVTKRDIFHVFWRYGELAQISIKQAYGFVQFLSADECRRAMEVEQGRQIRDKRIHLEVSKPQKNRAGVQNQNQGRRSRSPDYGRGGKQGAGTDRYVSGGRNQGRGNGGFRQRSASPPRGYRDRFDDRHRERSPAYGRGGGRGFRSPSPKRSEDDDLPLPKRAPRDVPDVQIIVFDSLERDFISWVEKAFSARGVRVDVLLLSPRLSEQAVIRRQIVEGVTAVVKLAKRNQDTGKIGLQVFDRSGGQGLGSVKFEEYDGLEPHIVVELVLRAKQTQAAPPPQTYGGGYGGQQQQQYGAPPQQQQYQNQYGQPAYGGQQQPPPPAGYAPQGYPPQQQQAPPPQNVQNLITSLDPNGLQNLLSTMGNQQSPQTPAYGAPQQGGYAHQQQQQAAMMALQQNPQMAAGLQQAMPGGGQQGGGQVNMQDILAKLGSYGK
ncbi:nuclear polyadenylated RNA-binding protein 3 [Elasticomyces elasticus]|nr:nuclear polyadenylated RNA-binding protein 3 [Elasticomyces elasticus]